MDSAFFFAHYKNFFIFEKCANFFAPPRRLSVKCFKNQKIFKIGARLGTPISVSVESEIDRTPCICIHEPDPWFLWNSLVRFFIGAHFQIVKVT